MNTAPKVHAMIVAAGRGSRFGAAVAKQYVVIGGQTLLQHSVARLADSHYIERCLLVIAEDDDSARTLDFALPIDYAIGGDERWQSVLSGLEALIASGIDADDLVLIHDAARPAVPCHDVEAVIAAAMLETYGAILATPVADTLKRAQASNNEGFSNKGEVGVSDYIERTIDRCHLWQAQTPQVFRAHQLRKVLAHVANNKLPITDEASAFEYLSLPIRLVTGSRQNIKLTYPDDAVLLAAILQLQSEC